MSSNDAASTEPLPEYVFGPWVRFTPPTIPLPAGTLIQAGLRDKIGAIFEASKAPCKFNKFRRAYRLNEWHEHDGSDEYPIARGTPVRVRFMGGREVDILASGDWSNVSAFRPIAVSAPTPESIHPLEEARTIIRDFLNVTDAVMRQNFSGADIDEIEERAREFLAENGNG